MPEATSGTFTQSPAGVAFSTLYARVANYVMGPSDADVTTISKEGLNEAIDKINSRNWHWAKVTQAITISGSTQEYALNAAFRAPRAAELLASSGEVRDILLFLDPLELDDMFPDRTATGMPTHYTVFNEFDNGKLTLSLTPSAAFATSYPTLRLRYFKRLAKFSLDADLFPGPSEVESFLVWYARSTVAAHWAPEKAAFADRRAEQLWELLVRDDGRRGTTAA